LIGEIVRDTWMRRPSLLFRSVSKWSTLRSGPEIRDDVVFLRDAILRNDERDVAADRLLGGVAEQPLGAGVPGPDDSVERLADDRIVRGFDDRREQPCVEQATGGEVFPPPALRNVAKRQYASGNAPVLVLDRRRAVVDRALDAVLADQHGVVGEADDGILAQRPRSRTLKRLARFLVDDPEHAVQRLAACFRVPPAGQ
jgi:hypothetical protein